MGQQHIILSVKDPFASGLDEEDHWQRVSPSADSVPGLCQSPAQMQKPQNATEILIDIDNLGNEWYTRLRGNEEEEPDGEHSVKKLTNASRQESASVLREARRIVYAQIAESESQ